MSSLWPSRPRGITPDKPGPGQESVWDYPRPPRVEPANVHILVRFGGAVLADTRAAFRVLETSHPPVYYLPLADIDTSMLRPSDRTSYCEFKGMASYYDLVAADRVERDAAWYYPRPTRGFEVLVGHVAIYPGRVDLAQVDGETVVAQEGDFYGGWRTSKIVGPFKGGAGTFGW